MPGIFLAAGIMLIICIINSLGAKFLSKTNSLIVVIKLLIPIVTIITLFTVSYHSSNLFSHGFAPNGIKGVLIALPHAGVIFSFIGFSTAIQLAGEAENPQRSIPFAIIGALLISIVFYSVLQLSFLGALNYHDIAKGWAHLSFKGDMGPFAGMSSALGLVWLLNIIYVGAIISTVNQDKDTFVINARGKLTSKAVDIALIVISKVKKFKIEKVSIKSKRQTNKNNKEINLSCIEIKIGV